MLREQDRSLRAGLLLVDVSLCGAVFFGASSLAGEAGVRPGLPNLLMGVAATLTLPLSIRFFEGQSTRLFSLLDSARNLLVAAATSGVVLGAVAFGANATIAPDRLFGILVGQLAAVGLLRLGILAGLRVARRHGRNYRNIVVIGSGPRAREFTETLERHPEWGLRLVGYVDEGDAPFDEHLSTAAIFKMVDFPALLRDEVIDEVITACPRSMLGSIGPAVEACSAAGVPLTVMNDLFGDYLPPPRVKRFAGHEALSFAPVHHNATMLGVKRSIDFFGGALGLLVAAPVLLMAAAAIKLSSPGPVFFRQIRCGLYGRPFVMYKLRTMVCDAETRQDDVRHLNEMEGPVFKIRHDPRVTKVGQFLRTFSVDELPQFWNVLVGDMSLVGPRPPIPAEVAQYKTWERRRLSMRPGLTCLWQVSGRNELDFDEWVQLDLQYIDGWSLGRDLKLLLQTFPAVLKGTGS